jgi:hypothetical protein
VYEVATCQHKYLSRSPEFLYQHMPEPKVLRQDASGLERLGI